MEREMQIAPTKSRRDYKRVLKETESLMMAKRNTPEGDRLDGLVTLVEAWEAKHYPLGGDLWKFGDGSSLPHVPTFHFPQNKLACFSGSV
jgi:hypothetical protein